MKKISNILLFIILLQLSVVLMLAYIFVQEQKIVKESDQITETLETAHRIDSEILEKQEALISELSNRKGVLEKELSALDEEIKKLRKKTGSGGSSVDAVN